MNQYCCYVLSTDAVSRVVDFEAATDAGAIDIARGGHAGPEGAFELWRGARLVFPALDLAERVRRDRRSSQMRTRMRFSERAA